MDVETKHLILAVHGIVAMGFFSLAVALFLSGAVVQAALRLAVGIVAVVAGVYFYRDRDRRGRS